MDKKQFLLDENMNLKQNGAPINEKQWAIEDASDAKRLEVHTNSIPFSFVEDILKTPEKPFIKFRIEEKDTSKHSFNVIHKHEYCDETLEIPKFDLDDLFVLEQEKKVKNHAWLNNNFPKSPKSVIADYEEYEALDHVSLFHQETMQNGAITSIMNEFEDRMERSKWKRAKIADNLLVPHFRKHGECLLCKKVFVQANNFNNFIKHVKSCGRIRYEQCVFCGVGVDQKTYKLHLSKHETDNFGDLVMKTNRSVDRFESNVYSSCKICFKPLIKTNMTAHIRDCHAPAENIKLQLKKIQAHENYMGKLYPEGEFGLRLKPKRLSLEWYEMRRNETLHKLKSGRLRLMSARALMVYQSKRIMRLLDKPLREPIKKPKKVFINKPKDYVKEAREFMDRNYPDDNETTNV